MILALLVDAPEVCDQAQAREELLSAHHRFIEAHLNDDIDLWRTLETQTLHSISGGVIREEGEERWARRRAYLEGSEFTTYADEQDPHLRIADDCSMAWMTVRVRVEGHPAGVPDTHFASVFAWVYLWQYSASAWQLEGVVSTAMDLPEE